MNKTIKIVLIIYLFQGIIHNLGHPVTPELVKGLDIPDYMFGVFFAMMSLGLTIGGPIWGVLGDRGNKRLYMSLGLVIYSIGQFMFAYVDNTAWMVFFRFLSGFGVSASVTLLISHIIEHSTTENRAKHLAWNAAGFTLGASLGYLIGGFIAENSFFIKYLHTDDLRVVFLIQALLNIVHAAVVYILIVDNGKEVEANRTTILDGFRNIRRMNKTLIVFMFSLTLITIGTINISKFLDVYFRDLDYSKSMLGTFVFVTGLVSLFTSAVIVPLVIKVKKDMMIILAIQLLSAVIVFIVFRSAEVLITLYTLFMVYVIIKAVYTVLEQNYISSFGKEGQYGAIMGVRQAFLAIGMVIGPIVGGFLYDIKPRFVFDFSVLMFIFGFVLLLVVRNRIKQDVNIESL